jgi:hypothetical protein
MIFAKPTPEPEPVVTGTDILRSTVKARNKRPAALINIAAEVPGVAPHTLEAFAVGKADLSTEALCALTKALYPHSEFDIESGMLRSANKEPARGFIHPPVYSAPADHYVPRFPAGPEPPITLPDKPQAKTKRAGWLGGFL